MIRRLAAQLAAAVLVTAAATLVLPGTPARAAYCSSASGVSVLVDYGGLGGGTATGCGAGGVASAAFRSAGFTLTPHPRQQTFVCKVQGKPADGNCMATDSYWGFFVSDDGKGWVYASQGVYQQAVDAGDSVALVWQSTANRRSPGADPAVAQAAPTKTPTATPQPTRKPKPRPRPKPTKHVDQPAEPSTSAATPVASDAPSATPTAEPSVAPSVTAPTSAGPSTPVASTSSGAAGSAPSSESSPTASGSTATTDATEPTASGSGGLPGWVPPLLVALLAVGAGGVAWARRTR